jgi:glycosyltransferase involved in cell wall biosynthesis
MNTLQNISRSEVTNTRSEAINMAKIKLSIIVPCYNEEKNIPLILDRFEETLRKNNLSKDVEVILVDNNSKDKSAQVLKKELSKKKYSFARTIFQPIPGYGAALQKGLYSAKGEYLCWTHGDIQTPPKDTITAYKIILEQKDPKKCLVKGNRHGRPIFDQFFTIGMSFFETLIFRKKLWDINAQPNVFHHTLLKKLKNPPTDFSFDLYVYYVALKNKYVIIRFPVFFGQRIHGVSAWNTGLSAKWKFIKRTLSFSFKLKKQMK